MRRFISFIGKKIYNKQYLILKNRLLNEHTQIKSKQSRINLGILEQLLISGEDHRFRYHFGFDIIAILRAIRNRLIFNKREGASTIEQQLVRVFTNDFKKTIRRKIKEIFLSTTLCELVPRKDIPAIYLHVAYYGTGMNGLEEVYKKLDISNTEAISNELCAEIIARIKYPQPKKNSEKRFRQIEMRKKHLLSLYNRHNTYKQFKIYG